MAAPQFCPISYERIAHNISIFNINNCSLAAVERRPFLHRRALGYAGASGDHRSPARPTVALAAHAGYESYSAARLVLRSVQSIGHPGVGLSASQRPAEPGLSVRYCLHLILYLLQPRPARLILPALPVAAGQR